MGTLVGLNHRNVSWGTLSLAVLCFVCGHGVSIPRVWGIMIIAWHAWPYGMANDHCVTRGYGKTALHIDCFYVFSLVIVHDVNCMAKNGVCRSLTMVWLRSCMHNDTPAFSGFYFYGLNKELVIAVFAFLPSRYFRQAVSKTSSTVKISDEVPRDSKDTINAVYYTKDLDEVFISNFEQDQQLR